MFKFITLGVSFGLLLGCQSTNHYHSEKDEGLNKTQAPIFTPPADSYYSIETDPENISVNLEGSKHKVWKAIAYVGVANELKDGEVILFKNVEAKRKHDGGFYYLGNVYSLDGQLLFEKKYSLSDVGVVEFNQDNIVKTVDNKVVNTTRGVVFHGNVDEKKGFSETYWKSNGGDTPKAIPVRDYVGRTEKRVAERYFNGLQITCISGAVYIGFDNEENIYAANGESTVITVTYPYSSGKLYPSKSVGFTGVSLKVDPYIERILLEEDAIQLSAFSNFNKKRTWLTTYNNGLAEAYSRVKNLCTM